MFRFGYLTLFGLHLAPGLGYSAHAGGHLEMLANWALHWREWICLQEQ